MREQAASLRRAERKAAKKPVKTSYVQTATARPVENKLRTAFDKANATAEASAQAAGRKTYLAQTTPNHFVETETPGRGEIVGGELAKQAEAMAALARKAGGTDAVQAELAAIIRIAKYEGQREADDRHMKTVKQIHEATTDKIVCSAIAEFELQMRQQGGLPPAITISSYTLCRMIDALNRAGYSAEGRKAIGN